MGIGLLLMILSVIIQASVLVNMTISQSSDQKRSGSSIIPRLSLAFALVVIRAASFLSNSYICECCQMNQSYYTYFNLYISVHSLFFFYTVAEGRVASFLLATSCITSVWHSVLKGNISIEVFLDINSLFQLFFGAIIF